MSKYRAGKGRTYGRVIKDGHTMTMYDVLMDLEKLEHMEERIKHLEEGIVNLRDIAENNQTSCGTCYTALQFVDMHHRDLN